MENDEREAVTGIARVGGRQPDEEFAVLGQQPRAHDLASEPAAEAVLPVGNRVLKRGVEPHLVRRVAGHIAVGIHRLAFPGSACDFVFEMRASGRLDFPGVEGCLPSQAQCPRGVPAPQRLAAAGNENALGGTVDRGNNAKANPAHAGNNNLLFAHGKGVFETEWN